MPGIIFKSMLLYLYKREQRELKLIKENKMKYKAIQEKAKEIGIMNVVGVKREDLIKQLNEHNISIEGEKFGFIHDSNDENNEALADDMVFKSISSHIRYLFDNNIKQSEIAKRLSIRDQFVSNVVRKYKLELSEKTE